MEITAQTSVREVIISNPSAARVFETLGVDYCCGGAATLAEASSRASVSLEVLLFRLHQATPSESDITVASMDTAALIDHIERTHHVFTVEELARAEKLMAKVLAAHGDRYAHLEELSQTLDELNQELAVHMQKEERVLFPFLRAMAEAEKTGVTLARPPFHSALNPIRVMHEEHDAAGIYLHKLRALSSGYAPPPDACGTFRALYESLGSLERDLHQHIHLENNLLFPRAAELERTVLGTR
jgi:regulator of cell morphogenesis and NO signaling